MATVEIADNDLPPDGAGNSISTALDLGMLDGSRTFRDWVGSFDTDDYYRFSLATGSGFNLRLDGLSSDADVYLLDSGGLILNYSTLGGSAPDSIATALNPGTYYVRVVPYIGNTRYDLSLSARPVPTVTIAATDSSAGEPNNPGQFTITRTGSTVNPLTVFYTLGGTATNGVDYSFLGNGVTLLAGQSSALIPVTILDDLLPEGSETVVLTLNPNGEYLVSDSPLGSSPSATVTIVDNEVLPTVNLAATDSSAGEPNNPGQFTITRTGSTMGDLVFHYSVGGTATNGWDYSPILNSVTIAAGESTATIAINPWDDFSIEGDETVVLTLEGGTYTVGSSPSATVTIVDDERIDLVGNFFDIPLTSLEAGQRFTATLRLQNLGNVTTPGFYTGLYLSSNATITTSDYLLDAFYLYGLASNSTSESITRDVQLPTVNHSFWSGSKTYYIGLIADDYGWVTESNEANNASQALGVDYDSVAVAVVSTLPDLRGTFFDVPEPLNAGGSPTVNFQIQNAGPANSGRFGIRFYLSNDPTFASGGMGVSGDRQLAEYHFDDLAANTTTGLLSLTLNLPIAGDVFWSGSKTYYIGMSIDEQNSIQEGDETNNVNRGNGLDWDDVPITVSSVVLAEPIAATGTPSSDPAINSLLSDNHAYWNTSANGGIITYSFYNNSSGPYSGFETVSEVSEDTKIQVRQFLTLMESYINVQFVEVADTRTDAGAIRYMLSNGGGYAYAYYPGSGIGGDIHLSSYYASDFSSGYGSYGYMTLIHETLHALGLKHPGNYNGGGTGEPPFLPGGEDNITNSVLSYNTVGSRAISPMPYDIRALQYLYGAKPARTTNTTYHFRSTTGYRADSQFFGRTFIDLKQALWDTGGVDTLDFSIISTSDNYYFDLREGGILTTQSAYNASPYTALGDGGSYRTSTYGTTIAFNTTIENLINSRSNDTIIANRANNVFKGYALGSFTGNDTIEQSSSADVLELAGYSLADLTTTLTTTMSGTDLTIGLGSNGTVQIKDYYGSNGSMKVWVNGTYYTYRASGGWQVAMG